ncbi:MAG: nucleotidyl transferase AbiEii/AbiGii toxin family protein [Thermoproteota archaeon]
MLTKEQLREYREKLPLHVIEQDYLENLVLNILYQRTEDLVFKGGTCLRKFYGLDRYSQDLDFTVRNGTPEKLVKNLPKRLLHLGVESRIIQKHRKDGFLFKLQYKGPLYTGRPITQGSIELDLSRREKILLEPEWKVGRSRYPEVRTLRALCLKEEEILAEKIRALTQRTQPRDLYDIWFLTELGIQVRKELVQKKLETVEIEDIPKEVLNKFSKKGYQEDLKNLVINPPSYQTVLQKVKTVLSQINK